MIKNFKKSKIYSKNVHSFIPGGAHTYSKGDDQFPELSPGAISHGKGAWIWDIDGNKFLEWGMGLTSISIGHADKDINNAVCSEINKGVNFSRPSELELKAAKFFLKNVAKNHEMIKFTKNGSTATTAAVKLSRTFTNKEYVAVPQEYPFFSYDDWFIGSTECDAGIPNVIKDLTLKFSYNSIESLEKLFSKTKNNIAAVIMEATKFKAPHKDYLLKVQKLCKKHGAVFILDEMILGCKWHLGGGQEFFGVKPDLSTWGKGIANGYSFCALTGKKEIMNLGGIKNKGSEKVFLVSTTHGSESHGLAAMMETIKKLKKNKIIEKNWKFGLKLKLGLNKVIKNNNLEKYIEIIGDYDIFMTINCKNYEMKDSSYFKTLLFQEMIKNGVLFNGLFYVMASHRQKEVNYTINAFEKSLKVYKKALENGYEKYLVGEAVKPVFRKYN
ncbi:glutamate-1-semialdehyde 2,1-aminomutase [Arcobacter sp. KX21116]|uniref:glutamate-1-semialdehyde 2,1-aminomutase n=1 Tax=Arcobacter iocasae TaxID=2906515 RepID=UPI0035D4AAC5